MEALKKIVLQGTNGPSRSDAYSAIRHASDQTGVDFDYLFRTAKAESGLNSNAKAPTSSATGLFQFTEDTWLRMIQRYGAEHGYPQSARAIDVSSGRPRVDGDPALRADILALRTDPELSSLMAAELANENASSLENRIGRKPTDKELYIAHFLGAGGAGKFINALNKDPDAVASSLFPREAKANPGIFQDRRGDDRSMAAVYARLTGERHTGSVSVVPPERQLANFQEPGSPSPVTRASLIPSPETPQSRLEELRRAHVQLTALLAVQTSLPDSD